MLASYNGEIGFKGLRIPQCRARAGRACDMRGRSSATLDRALTTGSSASGRFLFEFELCQRFRLAGRALGTLDSLPWQCVAHAHDKTVRRRRIVETKGHTRPLFQPAMAILTRN